MPSYEQLGQLCSSVGFLNEKISRIFCTFAYQYPEGHLFNKLFTNQGKRFYGIGRHFFFLGRTFSSLPVSEVCVAARIHCLNGLWHKVQSADAVNDLRRRFTSIVMQGVTKLHLPPTCFLPKDSLQLLQMAYIVNERMMVVLQRFYRESLLPQPSMHTSACTEHAYCNDCQTGVIGAEKKKCRCGKKKICCTQCFCGCTCSCNGPFPAFCPAGDDFFPFDRKELIALLTAVEEQPWRAARFNGAMAGARAERTRLLRAVSLGYEQEDTCVLHDAEVEAQQEQEKMLCFYKQGLDHQRAERLALVREQLLEERQARIAQAREYMIKEMSEAEARELERLMVERATQEERALEQATGELEALRLARASNEDGEVANCEDEDEVLVGQTCGTTTVTVQEGSRKKKHRRHKHKKSVEVQPAAPVEEEKNEALCLPLVRQASEVNERVYNFVQAAIAASCGCHDELFILDCMRIDSERLRDVLRDVTAQVEHGVSGPGVVIERVFAPLFAVCNAVGGESALCARRASKIPDTMEFSPKDHDLLVRLEEIQDRFVARLTSVLVKKMGPASLDGYNALLQQLIEIGDNLNERFVHSHDLRERLVRLATSRKVLGVSSKCTIL